MELAVVVALEVTPPTNGDDEGRDHKVENTAERGNGSILNTSKRIESSRNGSEHCSEDAGSTQSTVSTTTFTTSTFLSPTTHSIQSTPTQSTLTLSTRSAVSASTQSITATGFKPQE